MNEGNSPIIYQFVAYYGALIKNKVIYSVNIELNDCKKLMSEFIEEEPIQKEMKKLIEKDGFDSSLFQYRWITQEEYADRMESYVAQSVHVEA